MGKNEKDLDVDSKSTAAIKRWFSPVGEFVRLVTPGNSLLAVVLTAAAYITTLEKSVGRWMIALLGAAFVASLLVNWTREKIFGPPEQRIATRLSGPVGRDVSASVGGQIDDLESQIGTHHASVRDSLERVEALIETTAHGDLASRLGFRGLALPNGPESNSLATCLETDSPRRQLWVMGLQANKWINYREGGGVQLRNLLEHGMSEGADARFLLLKPDGETIKMLKGHGGESIAKQESVEILRQIADEHDNLKIEYYDELPRFRMVFRDGKLIVSCYSLDRKNRFRTKKGSDAPHLVIDEQTKEDTWPLYQTFASHFDDVWGRARVAREATSAAGKD